MATRADADPDGTSETEREAPAPTSDAELVAACLKGTERAWEILVRRYKNLVYAVPVRMGLAGDEADEVFQETFLTLHQRLATIQKRESVGIWLAVTARRRALNRVSRRPARREVELADDYPLDAGLDPIDDLVRLEDERRVREALALLPERCAALLRLLYYSEPAPDYLAIARELGMRPGSVGPTRLRCFEKLRRLLAAGEAAPDVSARRSPVSKGQTRRGRRPSGRVDE